MCNINPAMEKRSQVSSRSDPKSKGSSENRKSKSFTYKMKVILLGDTHTGKTSLLQQYCCDEQEIKARHRHSHHRYMPTAYEKKVQRNGSTALLQLNDTAGQERYRSLTHSYYRGALGCLIVFNVADETSLHNVCNWVQELKYYYNVDQDQLTTFLIGTVRKSSDRQVSREKAERFAEHLDIPYIEVELDNKMQLTDMFDQLTDSMLEKNSARMESVSQTQVTVTNISKYYTKAKENWVCSC